jgi:hypothetical protein
LPDLSGQRLKGRRLRNINLFLVVRSLCVCVFVPALLAAQDAPYKSRGREVEARQRVLGDAVARFHRSLSDTLRLRAPDLLPRLEPPPGIATGYQLLPRVLPAESKQPTTQPSQLVSYSWRWSQTLMERETAALTKLEGDLAGSAGRRSALDSLVTGYRGLTDRKRLVDADVNYNWLWQGEITRVRPVFDKNSALIDALLRQRTAQPDAQRRADSALVAAGLSSDVHQVDPPTFLTLEQRGAEITVRVPMVTDIEDTAFVSAFVRVVSSSWQARSADGTTYRLVLAMQSISPQDLYCGKVAPAFATTCAPPTKGAAINMAEHLARFPAGAAILTTGALSSHFEGGRAIVLSPHDAPRHMLVHEFGHVLGFRDAYIRGYRDAGRDGFVVTELVVDNSDVMGNSKDGSVKASHFERLRFVAEVPAIMKLGLTAFYERGDTRAAVARFQDVLMRQPGHYGASFQLAKALDALGQAAEAAKQWAKVLKAAEAIGDTATMRQVRARLSTRP